MACSPCHRVNYRSGDCPLFMSVVIHVSLHLMGQRTSACKEQKPLQSTKGGSDIRSLERGHLLFTSPLVSSQSCLCEEVKLIDLIIGCVANRQRKWLHLHLIENTEKSLINTKIKRFKNGAFKTAIHRNHRRYRRPLDIFFFCPADCHFSYAR